MKHEPTKPPVMLSNGFNLIVIKAPALLIYTSQFGLYLLLGLLHLPLKVTGFAFPGWSEAALVSWKYSHSREHVYGE